MNSTVGHLSPGLKGNLKFTKYPGCKQTLFTFALPYLKMKGEFFMNVELVSFSQGLEFTEILK